MIPVYVGVVRVTTVRSSSRLQAVRSVVGEYKKWIFFAIEAARDDAEICDLSLQVLHPFFLA